MNPVNENNNNLKNLRKAKGLSLADVASELKLTSSAIKKLEESKFKDIGAYTYVRGYMSHYTRLLGVDAEPYIELIPKEEFHVPLINTQAKNSKHITFQKNSKNLASYALGTVIVLVISFSGWFVLKNYIGNNNQIQDSIELVDNNNLDIAPQQETSLDTINQANSNADEAFHYSSLIPDVGAQNVEINPENINNSISNEKSSLEKNNEDEQDNIVITEEVNRPEQKLTKLAYEIKITASKTSWVKVETLSGVKLHNDLLQPGEVVIQSDEAIHFRIGNKDDVTVTINNQKINIGQFSKKNIADFNWPVES